MFSLRSLQGKYWLIIGMLSFLGTSVSSIVRSMEPMSFVNVLYLSVDWFAACIVYFFLGALFGQLIDMFAWRKPKEKYSVPAWFWLTLVLWVGGSILIALTSDPGNISPILIVFFPLAYGIFFVGGAFSLLFPDFVQKYLYGKLFLDILYLGVFAAWLTLTVKNQAVLTRRVLLGILFAVLFLGVISCAQTLS